MRDHPDPLLEILPSPSEDMDWSLMSKFKIRVSTFLADLSEGYRQKNNSNHSSKTIAFHLMVVIVTHDQLANDRQLINKEQVLQVDLISAGR